MGLSREELIGIAHAERQRLGRTIQYAPPESWEEPSPCAGWWNRDVVAHMAGQDTAAAQLLSGDPAEELDAYRATLASERRVHRGRLQRVPGEQPQRPPLPGGPHDVGAGRRGHAGLRLPAHGRRVARRALPVAPRLDRGPLPGAVPHRGVVGPRRGHPGHGGARSADPALAHLPHGRHGRADVAVDARGGRDRPPGSERPDRPGGCRRGLVALGAREPARHLRRTRRPTRSSRAARPSSRSSRRIASRWTTSWTPGTWCSAARPRSRSWSLRHIRAYA